ncbi:MAG: PIN domain-containing protein [Burkholderiales bacterium]
MAKISVDTNLLVYAIDTADPNKHQSVQALLGILVEQDTVVPLQALAEFYHVVTRKGHLSTEEARERIEDWQALFPVIAARPNTLLHAIDGQRRFQLPFWDAMLWATAQEAGVSVLLTEDFQDLAQFEGVLFVNPFGHGGLSEFFS